MTGRSTDEWIGSTPDAKIPPRVRARVFGAHDGICHISKRRIRAGEAWDCDHVIALCNGGEHRESNLAPALNEPHRIKTRADVREKSKVARMRKKHLGFKKPRTITAWRKMDGTAVYADRER
jgi:5-methylcytosine-specific restriction enzyme A